MSLKVPGQTYLEEVNRAARQWDVIALLVGGAVLAIAIGLSSAGDLPAWVIRALDLVGTSIVSAAIVSFVFGQSALRQSVAHVDDAVVKGLRDVLLPIRDEMLSDAVASYRWDCVLDEPPNKDPHSDYAIQTIHISYRTARLPDQLRFVCVASKHEEALVPFTDNAEYVFRWEADEELDPQSPDVFQVAQLAVDGQNIELGPGVVRDAIGGIALEYSAVLPHGTRKPGLHMLEFAVRVRKYCGSDARIRVQTHTFATMSDAEYRLTTTSEFRARRISPVTSGVRLVGPVGERPVGRETNIAGELRQAIVAIQRPIQKGSVIAFNIER